MTQDKKVKVTLSYTDCNNPYAYEPDVSVELDSYFDIQDWINKHASSRESYNIKKHRMDISS